MDRETAADPLDPSVLYEESLVEGSHVSPTGEHVAYLVLNKDPVNDSQIRTLYVVPADGSEPPHRLTTSGNPSSVAWGPDGRRLAFVDGREPDNRFRAGGAAGETVPAENTSPQVWTFDVERGGSPRQVTTLKYGVHEFDWSPTGDRIVVSARDPGEADDYKANRRRGIRRADHLSYKADGVGWTPDIPSYLFVVDVEGDRTRRLDDARYAGASLTNVGLQPRWSPDGDAIAFLANQTEDADASLGVGVHVVRPDGSGQRRLHPPTIQPEAPRWSPEGSRVSVVATHLSDPYAPSDLVACPVDGSDPNVVSAGFDYPVSTDYVPQWVDDETLLAASYVRGDVEIVRFSTAEGATRRLLRGRPEGWSLASFDYHPSTFALVASNPNVGNELFVDPSGGASVDDPVQVTDVNGEFADSLPTVAVRRVPIDTEDGPTEAIAYLPPELAEAPADASGPRSLLLSLPGGPVSCSVPMYRIDWPFWVSRGYVVLVVNYRGSESYGPAFAGAIDGQWGSVGVEDVLAAADAATDRGWVDPDRMHLQGFSYGALLGAFTLAESDRFASAALEHGNYDYRACYGTSDLRPYLEATLGTPGDDPGAYDDSSALSRATEIETPTLVVAGEDDYRAPLEQSERLYTRLRRNGVDAELVVYTGENHTVHTRNLTDRLTRLQDWFESREP
ncbi:hypothetical protein BRC81_05540 [Halobacteriales archaeon QS_1_68_20]|nr:MAG: hypothetical protein BRC81_05540 [Halobacteriales archaeon QS_1_68_20]